MNHLYHKEKKEERCVPSTPFCSYTFLYHSQHDCPEWNHLQHRFPEHLEHSFNRTKKILNYFDFSCSSFLRKPDRSNMIERWKQNQRIIYNNAKKTIAQTQYTKMETNLKSNVEIVWLFFHLCTHQPIQKLLHQNPIPFHEWKN